MYFRVIDGLTYSSSYWIFMLIIVVFLILGFCLSFNKQTKIGLYVNVATPFEIITVIMYYKELKPVIWICIALELLVLTVFTASLIRKPVKATSKERIRKIKIKRAMAFGRYLRNTFAIIFTGVVIGLLVFSFVIPSVTAIADGKKAEVPSEESYSENTIRRNYKELSVLLDEEAWKELSTIQKSAVLQTVCNIEAANLGLNHELNLRIENTIEADGSYDNDTHIIRVARINDNTPESLLNTVCHEAYHAMEYAAVAVYDSLPEEAQRLYYFDDVFVWKNEFENYKSATTAENEFDIIEYYIQLTELNARTYAGNRVEYYFDQLK